MFQVRLCWLAVLVHSIYRHTLTINSCIYKSLLTNKDFLYKKILISGAEDNQNQVFLYSFASQTYLFISAININEVRVYVGMQALYYPKLVLTKWQNRLIYRQFTRPCVGLQTLWPVIGPQSQYSLPNHFIFFLSLFFLGRGSGEGGSGTGRPMTSSASDQ